MSAIPFFSPCVFQEIVFLTDKLPDLIHFLFHNFHLKYSLYLSALNPAWFRESHSCGTMLLPNFAMISPLNVVVPDFFTQRYQWQSPTIDNLDIHLININTINSHKSITFTETYQPLSRQQVTSEHRVPQLLSHSQASETRKVSSKVSTPLILLNVTTNSHPPVWDMQL